MPYDEPEKKEEKKILLTLQSSMVKNLDTLARASFCSRTSIIRTILRQGIQQRLCDLSLHFSETEKNERHRKIIEKRCDDWDIPALKEKSKKHNF